MQTTQTMQTMPKEPHVAVRLFVEGEDAPARDFARAAVEAARAIVERE